jgi:hypothetical protein
MTTINYTSSQSSLEEADLISKLSDITKSLKILSLDEVNDPIFIDAKIIYDILMNYLTGTNVDNNPSLGISPTNAPSQNAVKTYIVNNTIGTDTTITMISTLTQAAYTALSPKIATTLYIIVG